MKLFTRIVLVVFILLLAFVLLANYKLSTRVEGNYVSNNEVKIHYTVEGEGTPVVLIHGFAANIDWNWRNPGIIDALNDNYKVIAIDLRGHGLSAKPHNVDAYGENLKKDIYAVLDKEGIDKAHLFGYSLGGIIGLNLAVDTPERWYSFTSMASGWERADTSKALLYLDTIATAIRKGEPIHIVKYVTEGVKYGNIAISALLKLVVLRFNDKMALASVIEGMKSYTIDEEVLRQNTLPIGIIVGTKDELLGQARGLAAALPNETYIEIEGGNHFNTPDMDETKTAMLNLLTKFNPK